MKIKKFSARTFAEALALVKKELSQDAIILSTEEKKGLRPSVEITAAIDYDAAEVSEVHSSQFKVQSKSQPGNSERRTLNSELATPTRVTPYSMPSAQKTSNSAFRIPHSELPADDLRRELGDLRLMIESMKNNGYEVSLPANKRGMLNFLRERAIREEFALRLCDRSADLSELPLLISSDIKIKRNANTKKAVMLAGPTGVGKTTTIAKLAAQAIKAGKKAAVINLDTYRIGAVEQVRIYSRILGIPLVTAGTAAEFKSGLAKFAETRDVVFIDTAGRNPRDEAYLASMAELCKSEVPMELHLLMSASADDEAMLEAYRSYRKLPIDYLSFTKVDEAVRFGSLYNLLLTYQKPVAYLTTGQRVPGDIEQATVSRIAGLIVKKEVQSSQFIVQSN